MCSYCGCESVDVIGRFMREHVEIINATGDLRRATERRDAALVSTGVDTVRALLEPHAEAEETGLFAVLAEDAEFTEHVHGLCREHTVLHQLSTGSPPARTPSSRSSRRCCARTSTARRTGSSPPPRSPSPGSSGSA